jgi:hypothetical protein
MPEQTFQIRGQVVNQTTHEGLHNLRVEAWDRDNTNNDLLGQATTDTEGSFVIDFGEAKFDDNGTDRLPDLFLKVFAGKRVIYSSQAQPIQDWISNGQPLVIEINPQSTPIEVEPHVEGEVVQPDGTPLHNFPVRAFDRAICQWRLLGAASTDEQGRYRINYDPAQITEWGKTRPDIKVHVYDPNDPSGDKILATSPLIMQAFPHEVVNFSIGQGAYRGPDEFTRVHRALTPLLQSVNNLGCLKVADVIILARESELSNGSVAYYIKSRRWATELNAPPAIFYGLLRQGQPARMDALFARPFSRLWRALEIAKAQNVINLTLDDQLRGRLAQIQQNYLARPDHPFRRLLQTTALSAEQLELFTLRLTTGDLTGDEFWSSLETNDGVTVEQVADLKATMELQSFTDDNTSLSIHLRGGLNVRRPREVAAFSVEEWRDDALADGVEIPDEVLPGQPEAERKAAYAQMLYRSAELRYPTSSLAGQMSRSQGWADQPLSSFLAAYPDFEFTAQRIPFFLQRRPEAVNLFPDPKTGRQELLRLEQMFHLTPAEDKLAAIQPLWDAGLRSARQIATAGRQQLLRKVGNRLAKSTANAIYHQAVHNAGVALNLYLKYHQGLNGGSLYAMRAASELPGVQDVKDEVLDWWDGLLDAETELPEWSELFGSPDACGCSHCQSTFGPGAYLVDMMYFLQHATDGADKTALDSLLERRPDLGALQLTCENTETEMPQIDLVIEIMEQIVAHSADGASIPEGSVGQTTWESEQLNAQPEHMDPAAYEKLREAPFPFDQLPFDLWLEEGRRYLKRMSVVRDELMRVMPPKSGVGALQIAGEALGMSTLEREIIRVPNARIADLAAHWGIDTADGTLHKQLGQVASLLKQARIDYDTLLRLLNTRYVNPGRLISVAFEGESCSLDAAEFTGPNGAEIANEDFRSFLDRLHRFIRLRQRLEWTEYDLDTAIAALGITDFNQNGFLIKLSDLKSLCEALDLSVGELCGWWGNLDAYQFEDGLLSRYEEVFLDPTIFPDTYTGAGPDLRNKVFALRRDRLDLAVTTSTTLSRWLAESDGAAEPAYSLQQDYATYIQSATQLTAEDLLLLTGEVLSKDVTTGNAPLNLANLSLLYRIGSFTRALDLSVQDYLYLVRLLGRSPLTTAEGAVSPSETMAVYERLNEINEGDWSIAELVYLLLDDGGAAATYGPTTGAMDAVLDGLSPGFNGIDNLSTARDNGELLTSLSQSLGASLGLDAVVIEALLFTHRIGMGDGLLEHLIADANDGFPVPTIPFYDIYETLHKFTMVWNGLGLDPTHLAFVVDQDLGWPDMASLPLTEQSATNFEAWRRLTRAAELQLSVFSVEQSLFGLLEAAKDPALTREGFLAQASESTGWNLDDLTYLTGPDGFDHLYPDAFLDERWVAALEKIFATAQPLGVSAAQAHAWAAAELTFAETESIKQTLTLAYDRDRWLEVMTGIQDELRVLKRDALLGYLLNNLSSDDPYDVYRHYLIDPQMAPCARTSRIVEAHAAVQLFAQRILLNLEPPLSFPREDAEAWQWRKNYRIWEAARKVLLYPENWIEPELRDNKSVFFKELEDGLLQDEVTFEAAERLYREYLMKLDQVSRLEIMGMYQDEEADVLHVFGRTRDVPALYYYRRWEDKARWTPWERVDLNIQADHLIPIVYNGRLYLFWPDFKITKNSDGGSETMSVASAATRGASTEKQSEYDPDTGDSSPSTGADISPPIDPPPPDKGDKPDSVKTAKPIHEIELRMAWSQYGTGGWSAKKQSAHQISYSIETSLSDPLRYHYFIGWVSGDNRLHIAIRINYVSNSEGVDGEGYVGYFYYDDCQDKLLFNSDADEESIHPSGEVYVLKSAQEFQSLSFGNPTWQATSFEITINDSSVNRMILNNLSEDYGRFHYASQYGPGGGETAPFFYSDDKRSYFVQLKNTLTDVGSVSTSGFAGRLPAARMARPAAISEMATLAGNHYGGITDGIISRADSQTFTAFPAELTDVLTDILADDDDVEFTPPIGTLEPGATSGSPRYLFTRFYHPYTCLFLKQLSRYGVEGLLNPDPEWDEDSENLYRQLTPHKDFHFNPTYDPDYWVNDSYPVEEIDFDHDSPYGSYNWELFFHIPLLIATRLTQNQRFSDARRWFNYIFDPTHTDGQTPARFWKIRPFYEEQIKGPAETLQELMDLLEQGSYQLEQQVDEWESDPFNPHAIARMRTAAYMKTTVMKYLDRLIAEADMLFTMDIRETINEAAQLYLLAADILGEKPALLPAQETETLTANLLLGRINIDIDLPQWDPLDLLDSLLSSTLPGSGFSRSGQGRMMDVSVNAQGAVSSYDTLFSFCIPQNDKLNGYWDTVADRLFKIRHCMNIAGVVRSLPLFAPPIDPALLVRASAAGLDIAAILSSLYEPLPKYRFNFMLQKAMELCGETRSLGGELLSALEKNDAEGLSLLRSAHEVSLLQAIRELKRKSVEEARHNLDALERSKESAEFRRDYYGQKQLMNPEEIIGIGLISAGAAFQTIGQLTTQTALPFYPVPKTISGTAGLPAPAALVVSSDWEQMTEPQKTAGSAFMMLASLMSTAGSLSQTMGGYKQRKSDWDFQAGLAKREIEQLDKQILAAEIRLQIAEADLENHEKQIAQAEEAEAFLKTKFTNQELYSWTISKISNLYFQTYQMAYKLAQQAEKCFRHELGPDQKDSSFISNYYWDSLKKGLLAGEQLNYDLRRMEKAYLEANQRELEMTKHISLAQVAPGELVTLRETGSCEFFIPEVFFDMDFAGHYFRRVKAVRVTIPCVVGPYANVSATLRLTESWIRSAADISADPEPVTGLPQTAIATSSANQDGGAFELNFNDPRYLPFEGAGVISGWQLELPTALRSFDYDTITDLVIHLSYTAREAQDGGAFKDAVNDQLVDSLNDLKKVSDVGLGRLFSLRREFAADWNRFLFPASGEEQQLTIKVSKQHFPKYFDYFWERNDEDALKPQPITLEITQVKVYLDPKGVMPSSVGALEINGRAPESVSDIPGLLFFDSVNGLSGATVDNESGVNLSLTVSGDPLDPKIWKDLYILLDYKINF